MTKNLAQYGPIQGFVAPGFESVKRLYQHELETMVETNTQLCVYYKGERVVDLWASTENDPSFSADSLVNVFSSGKSLEAVAMASLVGKGLLDYNAKIAEYWPEFGANGKAEITVADLMRHEGGMAAFDFAIDPKDLTAENIKQNRVGKLIEVHPARFPTTPGNHREYHAITRGWIANEIFRRVDPAGRTIGEYLREDISVPLDADAFIGVTEDELGRVSKIRPLSLGFLFWESLKPKFLGRRIKHNFLQLLGRILSILPSVRHATTRNAPAPFQGMKRPIALGMFNNPAVAKGETPSAAANCSARGLAKIAAMLAAGGKLEGREYLSDQAWKAMHDDVVEASMGFAMTAFTQGGVNRFAKTGANSRVMDRALNDGREGFYGWMGLGGSIFQWHPEQDIGFGFVATTLHVLDLVNERGKTYQTEVLACVRQLNRSI